MDFLQYIGNKKETAATKKWRYVYDIMAVHTQGKDPVELFSQRRPIESSNEYAMGYRLANYRQITKSPFDLSIDAYIEVSNNIDVTVTYPAPELKDYITNYYLTSGLRVLSLKEWTIQVPGRYRQTDPNAVVVVLPKHPTDSIIPRYDAELPDFNRVTNQRVEVDIRLVHSEDIKYLDKDAILFEAGEWQYSPTHSKDYYIGVTKEETYIIYPKKTGDKIEYVQEAYYLNALTQTPIIAIANALVMEDETHYYLPDYWGAAAWGHKVLGQDSDLAICETRFTYPEKFVLKTKCTAPGCYPGLDSRYYVRDKDGNNSLCTTCGGNGYIIDTGPMGTHLVSKDSLDPDGQIKPPVGYVSPDTAILQHSADRVNEYYSNMKKELNIIDQNFTNQSGESKAYDVAQKVTKVTNIVQDIYRIYDNMLNVIAEYRGYPAEVYVSLPQDFDIRSSSDMVAELTALKQANVPYLILVEATKKYMLKQFGNTEQNKRIFDFLAKVDKLFAYGADDMQTAKAIFGSDITQRELIVHAFGYQLLQDILMGEDPEQPLDFAGIKAQFDTAIADYVTIDNSL